MVWQGWGFLVVVFGVGGMIALQLLVDAIVGPGSYEANSDLWAGLGLLGGAAASVGVGLRLNRGPARLLVDEETGQRIEFKSQHTLFWVRMEYWGGLMAVVGSALLVVGLAR